MRAHIITIIALSVVLGGCRGARVVSERHVETVQLATDTSLVAVPLEGEFNRVVLPVIINPATGQAEPASIQKHTPRANVTLRVTNGFVIADVEVKDTTLLVPEITRTVTRTVSTESVLEAREPFGRRLGLTLLTGLGSVLLVVFLIMLFKILNK